VACGSLPALAGIWPDQIGEFKRVSAGPVVVADQAVWDEYGLDQAERAAYVSGHQKLTGTAHRLRDSTGAFAAFQWQRPAEARPTKLSELAVETDSTLMVAYGNYLLVFEGWKPQVTDLGALVDRLPKLEKSPLPTLAGYLPSQDLIPNSERYILGPASLDRFRPGIPPSVAAFHTGAEAQLGKFGASGKEMELVIFPTPPPTSHGTSWPLSRSSPGAWPSAPGLWSP